MNVFGGGCSEAGFGSSAHVCGGCYRVTAQFSPGLLLLLEPDALQTLGAGDEGNVPALFH